jgi:uncharacterized protein YbaR (Trm112 family)
VFIELAEFLRCPKDHGETFCVLTPETMTGRRVVRGTLGCPTCESEYALEEGVVEFGSDPLAPDGSRPDDSIVEDTLDAETVHALLGLSSPGGVVVLVGSVTRLAGDLAGLLDRVHLVGVNPPLEIRESGSLSLLRSPDAIPLRSSVARGVVLGREYATDPWLGEAARILLRGLRLVIAREESVAPGVSMLASGHGVSVGQKGP